MAEMTHWKCVECDMVESAIHPPDECRRCGNRHNSHPNAPAWESVDRSVVFEDRDSGVDADDD